MSKQAYLVTWRWSRSHLRPNGGWAPYCFDYTTLVSRDLVADYKEFNYEREKKVSGGKWEGERCEGALVCAIPIDEQTAAALEEIAG